MPEKVGAFFVMLGPKLTPLKPVAFSYVSLYTSPPPTPNKLRSTARERTSGTGTRTCGSSGGVLGRVSTPVPSIDFLLQNFESIYYHRETISIDYFLDLHMYVDHTVCRIFVCLLWMLLVVRPFSPLPLAGTCEHQVRVASYCRPCLPPRGNRWL